MLGNLKVVGSTPTEGRISFFGQNAKRNFQGFHALLDLVHPLTYREIPFHHQHA